MSVNNVTIVQALNKASEIKKSIVAPKKDVYQNVSHSEQMEIRQKHIIKYNKALVFVAKMGIALSAVMSAILIAISTGKCDKIINNILSKSCKPIDALKDFIQNAAKSKKLNQIDFEEARKHLHQENKINDKGLVSGAHEIKNLVRTLMGKNGNIISIKESKTQNGIWEIIYEINDKTLNEPKTVYLEEELSSEVIADLIKLCKKHNNKDLEMQLLDLIHSKKICNNDAIIASIEKALQEGVIIRGQSLEKSTLEVEQRLSTLSQQLKQAESDLKKAEETLENIKNAMKAMKEKPDFNPKDKEYQSLVNQNKQTRNMVRKLGGSVESIREKYKKQCKHYNHVKNSVNIYGENDGKLYAAYAHYEDKKLVVDSYFPISHGSKMQNEYLKEREKDSKLSFLDFKYLIGADRRHISQFETKLLEKLVKMFPNLPKYAARIGLPVGSLTAIAASLEIEKLNKEREKTK